MCLNIGTPNNYHFPFSTNGKLVVLGAPILKHFRVLRNFKPVIFIKMSCVNTASGLFFRNLMKREAWDKLGYGDIETESTNKR